MPRRSQIAQSTLAGSVACEGTTLHSGRAVKMTLRPAPADSGISFVRLDVPAEAGAIAANVDSIASSRLGTTLGNAGGTRIATVEHLLAALLGCGIDNAIVELDGPEVPAVDGSAAPFVQMLERAGLVSQDGPRRFIRVLEDVFVGDGQGSVRISPAPTFSVSMEIDYGDSVIGAGSGDYDVLRGDFRSELCRARTFCFLSDVDQMRKEGLALGGSLDNAVVVDNERVLNAGGLRYHDEFVRHKALDAVGDIALAGSPLLGHFQGNRSGHMLNHRLLKCLTKNTDAWEYATIDVPRHLEPANTG